MWTMDSSFRLLLEPFAQVMTAPTFQSLLVVLSGWLFARRRTVTGALKVAGSPKHFSSYHRVFSTAHWDLDAVGLKLAAIILSFLESPAVVLVGDDTLCRKGGRRLFGAGSHFDPVLNTRKLSNANRTGKSVTIKSRGHCWVVLGIALEFPFFPGHHYCLPVLCRLFLNRTSAQKHRRAYRTRPELLLEMLNRLAQAFPTRSFHLLIDAAYAGQELLKNKPVSCQVTAAWYLRAALYAPAPPRTPGSKGRRRVRGQRLPGIQEMLAGDCQRAALDVYGQHRTFRIASVCACFHATPEILLKVLAVEPLTAGGRPLPKLRAAYYSTATDLSAVELLCLYARRWSIEVTFRDAKQELGISQPQGYSKGAVMRSCPVLLLTYSLVVLWFAKQGHHRWQVTRWPWYIRKIHPSFADMLQGLRETMLKKRFRRIFHNPHLPRDLRKPLKSLLRLYKRAS
jgi:hypothetical protein